MNNYMLNKLLVTLLILGCLLSMLLLTDPNNVALPVLVVPFILVGCMLYQIINIIMSKKKGKSLGYGERLLPLSIACLGVALLLLRSLHQLTVKDSLLVLGFAAAFWLYIWRADFLHR